MSKSPEERTPVTVSFDVVWQGSSGKQDARMSEISMDGCFIDSRVQGRALDDTVEFIYRVDSGCHCRGNLSMKNTRSVLDCASAD